MRNLPFEKIVPRFKLHVTLIRATESCHSDETFLFFFVKKLREERMLDLRDDNNRRRSRFYASEIEPFEPCSD